MMHIHFHHESSKGALLCFALLCFTEGGMSEWTHHVTARLAMATLVALLIGAGGLEVRRQRALDCTGHCEG